MKQTADVVVIGAGIAGLSAAHHLARSGARVAVLEREPTACAHSSGRNAAIFRAACASRLDAELAARSRPLLDELLGREGWLRQTGALYLSADPAPLEAILLAAGDRAGGASRLFGAELASRFPLLAPGGEGLEVPGDGVIDIHSVAGALVRSLRGNGAELRTGVAVERIAIEGGAATGVRLQGGGFLSAGAWGAPLGQGCGAPVALEPRRRHLAQLAPTAPVPRAMPIVWRVDDEVYLRPESGGLLASPCDEEPWPAELPPASPSALELLARKLERVAPAFAASGVQRTWACLRTFAKDGVPIAGADPRVPNLHWIGGLGGHGMTGGLAVGEVAAASVLGRRHALAEALSPRRVI